MKKLMMVVIGVSVLAGCSQRSQDPQEQAMTRAAIVGSAEGQALRNAQALYPVQAAQSAHKHAKHKDSYKQLTSEAEATINAPISEASEFLISCGWLANKGKWHKQGYTLTLVVENGIVLNSQMSK